MFCAMKVSGKSTADDMFSHLQRGEERPGRPHLAPGRASVHVMADTRLRKTTSPLNWYVRYWYVRPEPVLVK